MITGSFEIVGPRAIDPRANYIHLPALLTCSWNVEIVESRS